METTTTSLANWACEVADGLHRRWPSIEPVELLDVALQLWRDARWRSMDPGLVAKEWLLPVDRRSAARDTLD